MLERSKARGWTLQVLYAWEAGDGERAPVEVYRDFLRERRVAERRRPYIERLVRTIGPRREQIDAELEDALTNWRLERLSVIDRNVLRIAGAEMLFLDDIPPPVSIQEAIHLAEKYGTAESPRFVNGVLDGLMRANERPAPEGGRP